MRQQRKARHLLILLLLLVFQQCREPWKQSDEKETLPTDTIQVNAKDTMPSQAPPEPPLTASLLPLDSANLAWLQSIRSSDTINVLLALNRTDIEHLFRQDTLVVPSLYKDLSVYCPYPDSIPLLDSVYKILLCSYPLEVFAVYENGKLVRWGPCSLGARKTKTPTGLLHTNWKSRHTVSTVNGEWNLFWYFNLNSKEGVSMHQYDLPGYPASHSCIRLQVDDAKWLYNWADQWILADAQNIAAPGTPVIVFGKYPFGKSRPWRRLDEKKMMPVLSVEDLAKEISPFLDQVISGQAKRDSVQAENKKRASIS